MPPQVSISPNNRRERSQSLRSGGFSLVEILAVFGVVALLAALTAPSVSTALKGTQLMQGAKMIVAQLDLARQLALSKNRPIEVRLYKCKGSEANSNRYRGTQMFEIHDSGVATPLNKVEWLPGSIAIDSGTKLSSIIGSATASTVPTLVTTQTFPIPQVETQYESVSFRFLPNGTTTLSPRTARWFLTLHNTQEADGQDTPGRNFYTIQIDAANGHIRTFRP